MRTSQASFNGPSRCHEAALERTAVRGPTSWSRSSGQQLCQRTPYSCHSSFGAFDPKQPLSSEYRTPVGNAVSRNSLSKMPLPSVMSIGNAIQEGLCFADYQPLLEWLLSNPQSDAEGGIDSIHGSNGCSILPAFRKVQYVRISACRTRHRSCPGCTLPVGRPAGERRQ